jgi:hypothetical protein
VLPILIGMLALIFTFWAFYILWRRAERKRAAAE